MYFCPSLGLHCFVIHLQFDPTDADGNIFPYVSIYNSLKRVTLQTNLVPVTRLPET